MRSLGGGPDACSQTHRRKATTRRRDLVLKRYDQGSPKGRLRCLERLVRLYFEELKRTVHWASGWKLGRDRRRFVLGREDLAALGIFTMADVLENDWDGCAEHIVCKNEDTRESCVLHFCDGKLRPLGLGQSFKETNRVEVIYCQEDPEHVPSAVIYMEMNRLYGLLEFALKEAGVQWRGTPNFRQRRDGVELLEYIEVKQLDSAEVLVDIEECRRGYQADLETVWRTMHRQEQPAAAHPSTSEKMSRKEANAKARQLLEEDPTFRDKTLAEWAKAIGCSTGLVPKLPAWKAVMQETGRGRKNKAPSTPQQPIPLTDKLHAVTDGGACDPRQIVETDEIMEKLITAASPGEKTRLEHLTFEERRSLAETVAQQQHDAEVSPLEDDPPDKPAQRTRTRKTL